MFVMLFHVFDTDNSHAIDLNELVVICFPKLKEREKEVELLGGDSTAELIVNAQHEKRATQLGKSHQFKDAEGHTVTIL